MRFALSVALKYLIPRRRQLSVCIISLVSIMVISLVVWLAVVFLSVTEGIEKKWLDELTTLNAPLKVRPTEAYYDSYYYLVDSISQKSNYTLKSLSEKLQDEVSDPYDPNQDVEPPFAFPTPLFESDGSLRNLAKEAKNAILMAQKYAGFRCQEFETGFGNLHLKMVNDNTESLLTQVSYIMAYDKNNKRFEKLLLPSNTSSSLLQESNKNLKELGEGIILPKGFQKNKVSIGTQGYISYYTPTTTGMQEQRLPVHVVAFYDPGMMPLGNKMIFADPKVPPMLKSNMATCDDFFGNGFAIYLDDLNDINKAKIEIQSRLEQIGLSEYFSVESFNDYEFSRPLFDQLKSDKLLFTLIALIILVVACSNIVSMLLLLVNDKKKEIAVLQSMGAPTSTVISIFAFAGAITGGISCLIGSVVAFFTLKHLDILINMLSFIQGRQAFQAAFFGNTLPNSLSVESLILIGSATFIVSLLAGIIPALKATRIRPSEILKSE